MGIRALLIATACFVRTIVPHKSLREEDRVGFDVSAVVHPLMRRHAHSICIDNDWRAFDHDVKTNLGRMKGWKCKEVIGVADGRRLDAKRANASRGHDRDAAWAKLDAQWEREGDLADVPKSVYGEAVGSLRPQATERLMCIAQSMDIDVYVAPFEAEHQLVFLQRTGRIDVIACNDSDYIPLGGDNLLICSKLWTGSCRFFSRRFLTEPPLSVGKRDEAAGSDNHAPIKAFQDAIVDAAKWRACDRGADAGQQRAMDLILRYYLLVHTDYSHIFGVGPRRAARIVADAWASGRLKLTDLADAAAGLKGVSVQADAALAQMRQAYLCLRHTLVFDPETAKLVPLHGEPHESVFSSEGITRESMGCGALAGIDLVQWYNGGYGVADVALRLSSPRVCVPLTEGDVARTVAAASVDVGPQDRPPHERPSAAWRDDTVKGFLKSKWVTMPNTVGERLKMAQWVYDNPRFLLEKDNTVVLEALQARREKDAWARMKNPGPWIDVHSSDALAAATLPALPANVVRSYLTDVGADTLRCTEIAKRRRAWGGKIMSTSVTTGADGRKFYELYFQCEVMRSVGHEHRHVFVSCVVDDASSTVFAVTVARCVYPDGCFDEHGRWTGVISERTGKHLKDQPTPCRQQSCGCVHGAVALEELRSRLGSSAERKRPRHKRDTDVDTHQSAVNAVFVGADGGWNLGRPPITMSSPFTTEHHGRISSGLADQDYKKALEATIETRKREYDTHYNNEGLFGMVGRLLAVESIAPLPKKSKSSQ